MRRVMILAAVFVSCLLTVQCAQDQEAEEGAKLSAIFDEEWEWSLKDDPTRATREGDYRYNDRLAETGLDAIKRRQQHDVEVLDKLEDIDCSKLSEADQLNYDLFLEQRKLKIEGHKYPGYLMPIHQRGGPQSRLVSLPEISPFRNLKDYEDYISRLNQIPSVLGGTTELMREGLKQGVTPCEVPVRRVADQIITHVVTKAEDSLFFKPFTAFPESIPEAERERLTSLGSEAITGKVVPTFRDLLVFWQNEYYPNCRSTHGWLALPNGKEWYKYLVKRMTTTDLTPEEIHEIGLREVERIRAEMDKVIEQSGFDGGFEEFVEFLRSDPQFYYTDKEDLITGYRDINKRVDTELPRLFRTMPRLTFGVKEIPAFTAPSQTTAYYSPGSLEAGLSGTFNVNTYMLDTRPKWEMEPLSIHEAVPGHHFQISLAQELSDLPRWRRHVSYTAFVEGWALYSESLGEEMGFYNTPYTKFGQLTYQVWRAIRLVVDTGIHYYGWDRQRAIDYFKANSAKTEHDIAQEIDRYMTAPAQPLAYKIGELKMTELRRFAEQELGDDFDIREFHDEILLDGALPLDILDRKIRSYVEEKKKSLNN